MNNIPNPYQSPANLDELPLNAFERFSKLTEEHIKIDYVQYETERLFQLFVQWHPSAKNHVDDFVTFLEKKIDTIAQEQSSINTIVQYARSSINFLLGESEKASTSKRECKEQCRMILRQLDRQFNEFTATLEQSIETRPDLEEIQEAISTFNGEDYSKVSFNPKSNHILLQKEIIKTTKKPFDLEMLNRLITKACLHLEYGKPIQIIESYFATTADTLSDHSEINDVINKDVILISAKKITPTVFIFTVVDVAANAKPFTITLSLKA